VLLCERAALAPGQRRLMR